jgi:REP element-mobilizing transposase RayT
MPRYRRIVSPGSVQHIISRFVDRCFWLDVDGARDDYLERATKAFARSDWRPLAFALMSSHVHWALEAGELPSASFMQPLHVGFAAWLNRAQQRIGPVFADRHRIVRFEGSTAAPLIAYIHNNPVRGGVASDATRSSWTSHRMYVGVDRAPPWLHVARGLELCGFDEAPEGRSAFHDFVRARAVEGRCAVLSGLGMQRLRRDARARSQSPVDLTTPYALDGEQFRVLMAPMVRPAGCPIRAESDVTAPAVLHAVAIAETLSVEALRSRDRARTLASGRRLALLVWTRHLGRPAVHMANALGLASSSAAELMGNASTAQHSRAHELALTMLAG